MIAEIIELAQNQKYTQHQKIGCKNLIISAWKKSEKDYSVICRYEYEDIRYYQFGNQYLQHEKGKIRFAVEVL
jgi:hypothetical protein